jgi:hypothetical protein
LTGFL